MNHRDSASKLIRWALKLQEYNIQIRYRTGKANANADTLSRLELEDVLNEEKSIQNTVIAAVRNIADIDIFQKDQSSDKNIKALIKDAPQIENMKQLKQLINDGKKYFVHKGILKYFDGQNELLVIPKNHQQTLMLHYHDGALGGHLSVRKTLSRLRQKYYWETMEQDVKEWCRTCKICLTRKNTGKRIKVPLKPMPVPLAPMEFCAMDIIGPLHLTTNGNKYVLVFCDYLTKWAVAIPMSNQKAETVAKVFVEEIIFLYGTPKKLLTDQGSNFMSEFFKCVTDYFSITKINTSAYHPQTDGLVERFNGTILNMIASYVNDGQTDWDVHLKPCVYAYNNAVHPSTQETPFYLMYLRKNNMPIDLNYQQPESHAVEVPNYKMLMQERMQLAWEKAGLKIKYNQEEYKEAYDKKAKDHDLKIGDLVYLHKPEPKKGISVKLQRPYKGPYRVCGFTATNVRLQPVNNKNAEIIVVHANRCKKVLKSEEPRYNFRPRKDKSENENQKMDKPKKIKNCNYLSIIPWICWLTIPLSQAQNVNYFPAKTELPMLNQLKVFSSYDMIIWNCQCNLIETFQLTLQKVKSLNQIMLKNSIKTVIMRNLKIDYPYTFRIKYWESENSTGGEPQYITVMTVWTKRWSKMLTIDPTWLSVSINLKSIKLIKIIIKYQKDSKLFSRRIMYPTKSLKIDNLEINKQYVFNITYYEAYLDNDLQYSMQHWNLVYAESYTMDIINQTNQVQITIMKNSIQFYRKSQRYEKVIISSTFMGIEYSTILNQSITTEVVRDLNYGEEYTIKLRYVSFFKSDNCWRTTLVDLKKLMIPSTFVNESKPSTVKQSAITLSSSKNLKMQSNITVTKNESLLINKINYYSYLTLILIVSSTIITTCLIFLSGAILFTKSCVAKDHLEPERSAEVLSTLV
jgi:hypothetical protein